MALAAITPPLTKLSRRPMTPQELAPTVDAAVSAALSGRRGPVHIALPFDLLSRETGIDVLPEIRTEKISPDGDAAQLEKAATLLAHARNPVVPAGAAAARRAALGEWQVLAAMLQAPVIPLESPRGLKDPSIGRFAELLPASDLIVLAGKPLDFTLGFGRPNALGSQRVVVLDPDAAVLDRARRLLGERLTLAVQCDAGAFLHKVAQDVAERNAMPKRAAWIAEVGAAVAARGLPPPAEVASA